MIKLIHYFKNDFKYQKWLKFIILVASYLLFEGIFLLLGYDLKHIQVSTYLQIKLLKYLVFIVLLSFLYRKYLIDKWHDFISNFKKYCGLSFKNWFIGFLLMVTINWIISSYIANNLGENEALIQGLIRKEPFILFIMTTFCAPFIEEMLFRKSLQDCFNYSFIFIIISGLLFGYLHVMSSKNPYEYFLILSYGSMGVMLAKTLVATDNIFCSIMMHMFHNGLLTLLAVMSL